MQKLLALAIAIAAEGFKEKLDAGGHPYILHCLYVMNQMDSDCEKIVAVLHDVPEDGIMSIDELRKLGFPENILFDLVLLDHSDKSVDYMDYIKRLTVSGTAVKVKKADLEHNSQITRLKGLTKKDFDRMEKYLYAYTYLSKS